MALTIKKTSSSKYIEDTMTFSVTGGNIPSGAEFWLVLPENKIQSVGAIIHTENLKSNISFQLSNSDLYWLYRFKTSEYDINIDHTTTDKINTYIIGMKNGQEITNKINFTFYIKPELPTFNVIPTYEDINSNSLTLTNNNQMIVNGVSTIEASNLKGKAYKGGQIDYIKVKNKSGDFIVPYSDLESHSYSFAMFNFESTNKRFEITLVDTRGWTNSYEIADISKFKYMYMLPKIKNFSVERDGISETSILRAKGYYSEGYQVGANNLKTSYTYKENISGAMSHDGITSLTITKSASREYEDFLEILNQFNNPTYQVDENNLQYYDKQTFENGVDVLFSTAISYNNNYTQEYLQADYDNANERYYCKSGGYNGSWKVFWQHTLEILYNVIYENGGNYEFEIESYIQGDTQNGFSIDKTFETSLHISDRFELATLSSESFLPTAIPAIDVYKDNVAIHGLYDENLGGTQINGDVYWGTQKLIEDTGWINANLNSSAFQLYSGLDVCQYRRIGNLVQLRGAVKPKNQIAADNVTTIFTLPSGFYNDDRSMYCICQGSGMNRWLLEVTTGGEVRCSRYGTTSNSAIGTGTWLPFAFTFLINDSI